MEGLTQFEVCTMTNCLMDWLGHGSWPYETLGRGLPEPSLLYVDQVKALQAVNECASTWRPQWCQH